MYKLLELYIVTTHVVGIDKKHIIWIRLFQSPSPTSFISNT